MSTTRSRRRTRLVLSVLMVALLTAATALLVRQVCFRPLTITANFSSATGLYPGDEVRIAGVRVGTVESITPQSTQAVVTMNVDHGVRVPADAKAVIVAQNLVAARYVQLAPLYKPGEARLGDNATIPLERTAVPVEWDEVKTQLSRLATDLGPQGALSTSSAGRFIESAANALDGNGDKLRQTLAQLSQLARILANGSGDIVATIENLQTFVAALRDSSDELVQLQNRLATFSTVLDDSRTDLDAAVSNLGVALGEVQRFIAGTRDKTAEQVQRLANVTQVLADHRMDLQNILHVAPTAFANGYHIINPNLPGGIGSFVINNFSNPVEFICAAIGSVENTTAPETAKLCAQYLGPALRLINFQNLPSPPISPFLAPVVTPDKMIYPDPALALNGSGPRPGPPLAPPAVSAYPGTADTPPPPTSAPTVPGILLPAEGAPQADSAPTPLPPIEGTPPS
jgi:phospholipid/cholesterol/gamma-HCH transport system substrate-binding protein